MKSQEKIYNFAIYESEPRVGIKISFYYKDERVYVKFRDYYSLLEIFKCIEEQTK